jgi:tungstate transport system permease protein
VNEIVEGFSQAGNLIVTLNPDLLQIAALSLYVSLCATILAAVITIPLGGFIHFREFRGKQALITLIQTLYSIPTVIVGLLVYFLLSRSGPLGFLGLLYSPEGMILGEAVLIIPIILGLVITALSGISRNIRDTIVSLGATEFQGILEIIREARFAIVGGVILGFGRAISEVGVAMMIGGNIRGETRVLTTAIMLGTGMGEFSLAFALGIILLTISMMVVILMKFISRRYEP